MSPEKKSKKVELLWDYQAKELVRTFCFSAANLVFGARSDNGNLYLFSRSKQLLWNYMDNDEIKYFSLSADGSLTAASSSNNYIYLFSDSKKPIWSYNIGNSITDISISPDGSLIAIGTVDGRILLFNQSGKLIWNYKTTESVHDIHFSRDNSVFTTYSGQNIYFFDSSGKVLWNKEFSDEYKLTQVCLSADGSLIAGRSLTDNEHIDDEGGDFRNSTIFLLDCYGQLIWNYEFEEAFSELSLSDDGSLIGASSFEKKNISFRSPWSNPLEKKDE